MRKVYLAILLAFGLKGFTQTEMAVSSPANKGPEVPYGSVTGTVTTTDNKPAAYVSVSVKGTNKYSITDENGNFTLKNIKEGLYTLEISMIGLKAIEKPVEIKKDQETIVNCFFKTSVQFHLEHRYFGLPINFIKEIIILPKDTSRG